MTLRELPHVTKTFDIAVFDGDGIGPEIMAPTLDLLDGLKIPDCAFNFIKLDGGAEHYAKTGESLPEASLVAARTADAILFSAMGMPSIRYPDGTEIAPQIDMRKDMDLFAGVRPVKIGKGTPTPLKLEGGQQVDFVLIRESTEGLFWSQGKSDLRQGEARETLRITRDTSEKLFEFSFNLARQRKVRGEGPGKVTCIDKANVFTAFAYFREIFYEVAARHPDIEADHVYVDATALYMVERPWMFDVAVTENMFGDILSDLGAGLMGGLGLAPSADIGEHNAVFQPCHGSAPDIAGRGLANPLAMIMSAGMMLDWLGINHGMPELEDMAKRIHKAVADEIEERACVTPDLGGAATTAEAGAAIAERLA